MWLYARRALPWGFVLGATAAGVSLFLFGAWYQDGFIGWQLPHLGMLLLAAAAAIWVDEPAAAVVDATPRSLAWQRFARLAVLLAPLTAGVLGVAAWSSRFAQAPFGHLLLEAIGILLLTMSVAVAARRLGRATPGDAAAAIVGMAVLVLLFIEPLPRLVQVFPGPGGEWAASSTLWSAVVAGAVAYMSWDSLSDRPTAR
jgi:hypothetical protein